MDAPGAFQSRGQLPVGESSGIRWKLPFALGVINKTLRLDTRHKEAIFQKGTILIKLKSYKEAVEAFEESIASHPHTRGLTTFSQSPAITLVKWRSR